MKKYIFLIIFLSFIFSSCEVYERYYVYTQCKEIKITVKVTNRFDLPKNGITITTHLVKCKRCLDNSQKDVKNEIVQVNINSLLLQYSFNLPSCYTTQLLPTGFGKSNISYIIINDKDTIPINKIKILKKPLIDFEKMGQQHFLLHIK